MKGDEVMLVLVRSCDGVVGGSVERSLTTFLGLGAIVALVGVIAGLGFGLDLG